MKNTLACLLVLIASPVLASDFPARVVGVTDGDTITVLKPDKTQIKVRLQGVDAPESAQDFGSRAKQAASELAFGKDVTVREVDHDRYGRTVGEVILPDGRLLGHEMVGRGMAWWYRQYAPTDRELARLEGEARAARRGLWEQSSPIPPWDWRHGTGAAATPTVVGNRNSHIYHTPHCRAALIMKPTNRVEFADAAEAERAGYRKGKDCR